jgi:hypothetical protein
MSQPRKVRIFDTLGLGCGTVVVVQRPAKARTPPNCAYVLETARFWKDEPVAQTLVVALSQIQLSNTTPILGIAVKSAIPGTHGMAEQCGFMPVS